MSLLTSGSFEPPSLGLFPPLEYRLAPVIDTDRALRRRTPLRAVCREFRKKVGELGVPTVLPRQPLDSVAPSAGSQTTVRTGTRTSDRISAPSRGMVASRVQENEDGTKPPALITTQIYEVVGETPAIYGKITKRRVARRRDRVRRKRVNDDSSWDRRDWQYHDLAESGRKRSQDRVACFLHLRVLFICTLEQHRRAPLCSCRRLKRR